MLNATIDGKKSVIETTSSDEPAESGVVLVTERVRKTRDRKIAPPIAPFAGNPMEIIGLAEQFLNEDGGERLSRVDQAAFAANYGGANSVEDEMIDYLDTKRDLENEKKRNTREIAAANDNASKNNVSDPDEEDAYEIEAYVSSDYDSYDDGLPSCVGISPSRNRQMNALTHKRLIHRTKRISTRIAGTER